MKKVHQRFERWRRTRRGRAPIPKRLWAAVAGPAREHGVNPTSKALGLEFKKLKPPVEERTRARDPRERVCADWLKPAKTESGGAAAHSIMNAKQVRQLFRAGTSKAAIARQLQLGSTSVRRILKERTRA